MKSVLLKVHEKIPEELDLIQEKEGLGNRTATVIFLIKYYFATQKRSLDESVELLDRLLDKVDWKNLPSAREQLKDI